MPEPSSTASATQASTPWSAQWMRIYNQLVLRYTLPVAWRCPPRHIIALYSHTFTAAQPATHLEVGPGTGKLLAKATWPRQAPELHLLDKFPDPLARSARTLRARDPALSITPHQHDALNAPWPFDDDALDSVACCNMIHCLPGHGIADKTAVLDELARVMAPTGRGIGTTLVVQDHPPNAAGQRVLRTYNDAMGALNCREDSLVDLGRELHARFAGVRLWVRGVMALWQVHTPR